MCINSPYSWTLYYFSKILLTCQAKPTALHDLLKERCAFPPTQKMVINWQFCSVRLRDEYCWLVKNATLEPPAREGMQSWDFEP